MIKIKNVRPGILIIADAGLKLAPGESRDLNELTPQARQALDNGLLAQMDREKETKPASNKVSETKSQSKAGSRKTEEKGLGKSEAAKSESTEPTASESTDNAGGSGGQNNSTQKSLIEAESGDQ